MRNYPSFPRATPHQKAGSPRVPHPSATRISEKTTFDLHALGTPPALILSQDQTLHQSCLASTPAIPKDVSSRLTRFVVRLPTRCCDTRLRKPDTHAEQLFHLRQATRDIPRNPAIATAKISSHARLPVPSDPPTCQGASRFQFRQKRPPRSRRIPQPLADKSTKRMIVSDDLQRRHPPGHPAHAEIPAQVGSSPTARDIIRRFSKGCQGFLTPLRASSPAPCAI